MKSIYILILLSLTLSAYEGCGVTKQDAIFELSGNIRTTVDSSTTIHTSSTQNGDDETIEQKIDSLHKNSTHLSLVNITHSKKKNLHCASVEEKDQIKNTRDLFNIALLFDKKNLPTNIDEKIKKLSLWLNSLDELKYLVPSFYNTIKGGISKAQATLEIDKKIKNFQDIYDESITKANSLVFKACDDSKEEAFEELNKQLFKDKTKKKDDEGAFGFFTSIFKSSQNDSKILDLFSKQIIYTKQEDKQCAMIKKDELLNVANNLNNDIERFSINTLSKLPKKRYDEIINYQEHLNVTKALITLFPKNFTKNNFTKISTTKQKLADILKTTYPQSVKFTVSGAENIVIKIDDKKVTINKEIYLKTGEHTYTISAKDKCPIIDTFTLDLKEDEEISKDFIDMNYPTVLFATDKSPSIIVNGVSLKVNVANPIKQCDGEVRYLEKYSGQSRDGEIELKPNGKTTIDLNFSTSQELAIFNDAKTKSFTTTTEIKISNSLTPISSKNLKFSIENKPDHGDLTLHEKGNFTYISDENFVGIDSFEYIIEANGEDSAPKIVNITVNNSTAPIAVKIKKDDNKSIVEKVIEAKKEIEEEIKEVAKKVDEKTQNSFNALMNSNRENIEKLKKFQAKYPEMFKNWLDGLKR